MYRCESCGTVFDEPAIIKENRPDADGFFETMNYAVCPVCGYSGYEEVSEEDDWRTL